MERANYILSILRTQPMIVFSWGVHQSISIPDGLKFKVQGFKHAGWVLIKYNEGTDLFDITLSSPSGGVLQNIENIYCDELVDTIDYYVERANNYNQKVIDGFTYINYE